MARVKSDFVFNKKLFFVLIMSILLAVGIAVSIVFIVLDVRSGKQLEKPTNLVVYVSENTLYAKVDEREDVKSYVFKLDNNEFVSPTGNTINLSAFLTNYKDYEISASVVGKKQKSQSVYTEKIIFKNFTNLNKVQNFSRNGDLLVWSTVEKAESYELLLNNNQTKTVLTNSFSLEELPPGNYRIKVRAMADGVYLKPGEYSDNAIELVKNEKLVSPTLTIIEDEASNIFRIGKVDGASGYEIKVNADTYYIDAFSAEHYDFDVSIFKDYVAISIVSCVAVGSGNYENSNTVSLNIE